jgi:DNA-binding IclR family transcriptional regulator
LWTERRRQSAYVSRLFKRLHVHGLIAKIPRSRRWRISQKGLRVIGAAVEFHHAGFFEARQTICDNLVRQDKPGRSI